MTRSQGHNRLLTIILLVKPPMYIQLCNVTNSLNNCDLKFSNIPCVYYQVVFHDNSYAKETNKHIFIHSQVWTSSFYSQVILSVSLTPFYSLPFQVSQKHVVRVFVHQLTFITLAHHTTNTNKYIPHFF